MKPVASQTLPSRHCSRQRPLQGFRLSQALTSRSTCQQQPPSAGAPVTLASAAAALLLLHTHVDAAAAATMPARAAGSSCNVIAQLADGGFMGFGGTADGSNPFTLYGAATKKYVIEQLDGEKIVSRKRGFTVSTCATVLSVEEEDLQGPRFQGLPVGEKVRVSDTAVCSKAEGTELRSTCSDSCESSCRTAIDAYSAENKRRTGIELDDKDLQRVAKSCIRDCRSECSKPGKVFDFVVPSRR